MLVSTRENVSFLAPIKEIFTAVYAVRSLSFSSGGGGIYPVLLVCSAGYQSFNRSGLIQE